MNKIKKFFKWLNTPIDERILEGEELEEAKKEWKALGLRAKDNSPMKQSSMRSPLSYIIGTLFWTPVLLILIYLIFF